MWSGDEGVDSDLGLGLYSPLGADTGATKVPSDTSAMDAEVLNTSLDLEDDTPNLSPGVCNVNRVKNYASSEDNESMVFPLIVNSLAERKCSMSSTSDSSADSCSHEQPDNLMPSGNDEGGDKEQVSQEGRSEKLWLPQHGLTSFDKAILDCGMPLTIPIMNALIEQLRNANPDVAGLQPIKADGDLLGTDDSLFK